MKLATYTFSEPSIKLSTLLQLPDVSPEFSFIAPRRTEVASSLRLASVSRTDSLLSLDVYFRDSCDVALPIGDLPTLNVELCESGSNECSPIAVKSELDLAGDGDHVIVTLHIDKVGVERVDESVDRELRRADRWGVGGPPIQSALA